MIRGQRTESCGGRHLIEVTTLGREASPAHGDPSEKPKGNKYLTSLSSFLSALAEAPIDQTKPEAKEQGHQNSTNSQAPRAQRRLLNSRQWVLRDKEKICSTKLQLI